MIPYHKLWTNLETISMNSNALMQKGKIIIVNWLIVIQNDIDLYLLKYQWCDLIFHWLWNTYIPDILPGGQNGLCYSLWADLQHQLFPTLSVNKKMNMLFLDKHFTSCSFIRTLPIAFKGILFHLTLQYVTCLKRRIEFWLISGLKVYVFVSCALACAILSILFL